MGGWELDMRMRLPLYLLVLWPVIYEQHKWQVCIGSGATTSSQIVHDTALLTIKNWTAGSSYDDCSSDVQANFNWILKLWIGSSATKRRQLIGIYLLSLDAEFNHLTPENDNSSILLLLLYWWCKLLASSIIRSNFFLGKYLNELSGCEQRPNAFLNMID